MELGYKWTDSKSKTVRVKGAPEEKHVRIYKIEFPEEAEPGKYYDFEFIVHVDKGRCKPALGIRNDSSHDVIFYIAGREFRVRPGEMIAAYFPRELAKCSYLTFKKPTRVKFEKEGTYKLTFLGGYFE